MVITLFSCTYTFYWNLCVFCVCVCVWFYSVKIINKHTLWSYKQWNNVLTRQDKGDQSWVFIGRTDVEAETPIFWPPDAKSWLIGKDPDAGDDWRREEKGTTEDEIVGWHHWLDGREFEQSLGVGDGQGGLVCCRPWGRKELDTTEWLNWTEAPSMSTQNCCSDYRTNQKHRSQRTIT